MPDERNDHLFTFASLSNYPLNERILIRVAGMLFYTAIRAFGLTSRFEVRGMDHLDAIAQAGRLPIYTSWHDRIFLSTYAWRDRGIAVMTSRSFDGEYIARFIQRFGYGSVRGSSSRGGARGLVEMIKAMRDGHPMGFTVDGPRGPKYVAKPGPVMLAKKTGNAILPFLVETRLYVTVNSWDKMQIPVPFSRSLLMVGDPIYVDANADAAEVEAKQRELQNALDDMVEQGREWSGR